MAYFGLGQITDPMDPKVQAPLNPPWLGRGDEQTRRTQVENESGCEPNVLRGLYCSFGYSNPP